MISLSRHIELLLLEHNCVIVPGLGGFIANTASAEYNDGADGDKLFIPPFRTIGFNPQLQVNDGLLVQSYMQAYDASYPSAYLQMEKEVEQLNTQLNLFGEYNLEGIGILRKSLGQSIELTSPDAGILTPSLYGTYSFSIKSLEEVIKEREKQNAAANINIMPIQTESDFNINNINNEEDTEAVEEKKEISLKGNNKRRSNHNFWFDFSIAASVAAILFFAFLASNVSTLKGKQETYIAGTPLTQTASSAEATDDTNKETTSTDMVTTADTPKEEKAEQTEPEKKFTIVLASCVSEENSNIFINNLAAKGFKEAKFVTMGTTNRIIYSSFATMQEAYNALAALRSKNEAFKSAWTLEME